MFKKKFFHKKFNLKIVPQFLFIQVQSRFSIIIYHFNFTAENTNFFLWLIQKTIAELHFHFICYFIFAIFFFVWISFYNFFIRKNIHVQLISTSESYWFEKKISKTPNRWFQVLVLFPNKMKLRKNDFFI